MYFFSNSPVKWRLTKVVCDADCVSISDRYWRCGPVELMRGAKDSPQLDKENPGGRAYLSRTTITDKHKLEGRYLLCGSVGHCC